MEADFINEVGIVHKKMIEAAQPEKGLFDELHTLRKQGWLTKPPPKRKYLFNSQEAFGSESGFLPEGKACMIVSPGGCGKTFLLAHCALAAATGTSWLHTKATRPVKVLFIAAEEDKDELWNRFYNMAKGLGFTNDDHLLNLALDNVVALAGRGLSHRLIDDKGEPKKIYDDLKAVLENDPEIKLVILDPASRFMGNATETDNAAATDWVNLIDGLTLVGGKPTVLVAHHTNKTALRPTGTDKKPSFDQSMARGASALIDGFRWALGLQRSETKDNVKSIFIKMLKSNYSKLGQILEFEQDYENSGTLKLIGEVTKESENFKKVSPLWEEAKRSSSFSPFNSRCEPNDDD